MYRSPPLIVPARAYAVWLAGLAACWLIAPAAAALDLLPSFLAKPEIHSKVWDQQEQYVALTSQGKRGEAFPPNAQPVSLESTDIRDALKSLQMWAEGGFFREDESHPVFTEGQAALLGQYIAQALAKAKPNEDVIFNVRGYGSVVLDKLKEREWTAGRVFYVNGRLNLIIGTYRLKKDRGMRGAEAAHGIIDNYDDLVFDTGNRAAKTAKMDGRIVSSSGITVPEAVEGSRNDWVAIDVPVAAQAYREALIPEEQKKTAEKAKQEAAKLTLERREMREEMARLRQQVKELSGSNQATAKSLEERLATLQALRAKNLITEEEYQRRRDEILKDI
jgi:hypothetical protein